MVQGQLIFKARIDYSLWENILDLATTDANDGYTGLLEYLEEPVNCHCEGIEGTKWCEIQLGADSFRETEWVAIHRIISCILWYATVHDPTAMQYYEWEGLEINNECMNFVDPFDTTKILESEFHDFCESLTGSQAMRYYWANIGPLKNNFLKPNNDEEG
jgi:hypothetical protein